MTTYFVRTPLALINSRDSIVFFVALVSRKSDAPKDTTDTIYIGLVDEHHTGFFRWTDGTNLDYQNWANGMIEKNLPLA
jgi:hypothetical protein